MTLSINVTQHNNTQVNTLHHAECHYAEGRHAECHYAECQYSECHGAIGGWGWVGGKPNPSCCVLDSRISTVVELSPRHLKVKGLNPAESDNCVLNIYAATLRSYMPNFLR